MREGKIIFRMRKGRRRATTPPLVLPIIPELRRLIDASKCGDLA
jgi:hypothetical protein